MTEQPYGDLHLQSVQADLSSELRDVVWGVVNDSEEIATLVEHMTNNYWMCTTKSALVLTLLKKTIFERNTPHRLWSTNRFQVPEGLELVLTAVSPILQFTVANTRVALRTAMHHTTGFVDVIAAHDLVVPEGTTLAVATLMVDPSKITLDGS